ncbi:MAG: DUF4115 domain-containing protein [Mariprofundaceae bacterium]
MSLQTESDDDDDVLVTIRHQLGEKLRAARQKQGHSTRDVADHLRISQKQVEMLESGLWQPSLDDVYLFGFMRQMAVYFDIDIHQDIADLQSENYRLTRPYTIPDPPVSPGFRLALVSAVVFVLTFVFFNMGDRIEGDMGDEVSVGLGTPIPTLEVVDSTLDQEAIPELGSVENVILLDGKPVEVEALPTREEAEEGQQSDEVAIESTMESSEAVLPAAEPAKFVELMPSLISHHYRVSAVSHAAWLRISEPDGTLIREALLQPGDSLDVRHTADYLLLTCGNAGAIRVEVDQKVSHAAGSVGKMGEVVKAYKLKPL